MWIWSTSKGLPGQDDGADTRQPAVQSVDELSWSGELASSATTLAASSWDPRSEHLGPGVLLLIQLLTLWLLLR